VIVIVLSSLDSIAIDSNFHVTFAGGSPTTLASNLSISPAETVISLRFFLSIFGGRNLAFASLGLEG